MPAPSANRADRHGPYFKFGVYTVHPLSEPASVHHTDYRRAASHRRLLALPN